MAKRWKTTEAEEGRIAGRAAHSSFKLQQSRSIPRKVVPSAGIIQKRRPPSRTQVEREQAGLLGLGSCYYMYHTRIYNIEGAKLFVYARCRWRRRFCLGQLTADKQGVTPPTTCSLRQCKARQGNNTYRLYLVALRWKV